MARGLPFGLHGELPDQVLQLDLEVDGDAVVVRAVLVVKVGYLPVQRVPPHGGLLAAQLDHGAALLLPLGVLAGKSQRAREKLALPALQLLDVLQLLLQIDSFLLLFDFLDLVCLALELLLYLVLPDEVAIQGSGALVVELEELLEDLG